MRTPPLIVVLLLGLLAQPVLAAEPAAEAADVAAEPAAQAAEAAKASAPAAPDPVLGAPRPPEIPLEDIRTFTAVFRAVQDAYVEPVDDHTLMQSAIRGLLAGLDPHSEFLDTRGLGELDEQATGEYAGLGVEVLFLDGVLRVIAPIDDTPAAARRDQAGRHHPAHRRRADRRRRGRSRGRAAARQGRQPDHAERAARGPRRAARDHAAARADQGRQRARAYAGAGLRLRADQPVPAGDRRRVAAQAAPAPAGNGRLKGTVLDLRSNPGGLLERRGGSERCLPRQRPDREHARAPAPIRDLRLRATQGDLTGGAPMVVLVDGGSASCGRDRGRCAQGQPPRAGDGHAHLRQGFGADRAAAGHRWAR